MSDSIIWHRISTKYRTRFVNDILCISDYLPDGLTINIVRNLCKSAKGSSLYYQELLNDPHPFSFKVRAGIHAYFVRYSLHANYSWNTILSHMRQPIYASIGVLAGSFFFLRDRGKGIPKNKI
jgi:hypoxanthine-guanine phosphoribosyltransferase